MIIAGPNLTIDRTSTIPELRPGEVLRFEDVAVTPGGKGVNVARVARALAAPAVLVGFVPGHTGRAAGAMLADELRSHRVLTCSGSAPPGAPRDAYARLAALARGRGAVAIVDANGPLLSEAVGAGADLVSPNLAEAEGVLGRGGDEAVEHDDPVAARARAAAASADLTARGAGAGLVTAGSAGAAFSAAGETWWHPASRLTVRNPIGAGDSVVGGIAVALERGEDLRAAVRFGLAAGAASVETAKAGAVDPARVAELLCAAPPAERLR